MPPPVTCRGRAPGTCRAGTSARSRCVAAAGAAAAILIAGAWTSGCRQTAESLRAHGEQRFYPRPPQTPRVVALGTLRGGLLPSQTEIELALFLFGEEPLAPLMIVNPADIACRGSLAWVWDATLTGLLRLDLATGGFTTDPWLAGATDLVAIDVAPDGTRFAALRDRAARLDDSGQAAMWYRLDGQPLRPAAILAVGDTLWITNVALHRIELFDIKTGAHLRSLGTRGRRRGEFGLPRGLARMPDGNVAIVDQLNNRVQVLSPDGSWTRDIGQPGDAVGTFGRPRDVAVGPDDTIFVTDAYSRRVHAFTAAGEPLLAFGEPGSGAGALTLPGPIAITPTAPAGLSAPLAEDWPADRPSRKPLYYVLVGEQLDHAGVRVYAWLGREDPGDGPSPPDSPQRAWTPRSPELAALNPHWHADRCTVCHAAAQTIAAGEVAAAQSLLPIPPARVDPLCLSCHDGVRAPADPHPIGRPAVSGRVKTPDTFPTHDGTIGCITCHDIRRQCDPAARRPAINPVLLRRYDPADPLAYCSHCHVDDVGGRFSPHRQADPAGRMRVDACLFCHTRRPDLPPDGRRRFQPVLRAESSDLCLNCHTRHWDFSPAGHVDRPVTEEILSHLLHRDATRRVGTGASEPPPQPARLPLGAGRVTCYTCHNPHYAGMFPPDTELGTLADNPDDRAVALRMNWIDLCSECHAK